MSPSLSCPARLHRPFAPPEFQLVPDLDWTFAPPFLFALDSLGGNAKTLMFVNISPADYNRDETLGSLDYAARAKLITNEAAKNADSEEVASLKSQVAQLQRELLGGGGEGEEAGVGAAAAAGAEEEKGAS